MYNVHVVVLTYAYRLLPVPPVPPQDDPSWYIADPICTFFFALLVLWTTKSIMVDISAVLMERAPRGLCIKTINDDMSRVGGVGGGIWGGGGG